MGLFFLKKLPNLSERMENVSVLTKLLGNKARENSL